MLQRTYRAVNRKCAEAIADMANDWIDSDQIKIVETGSVNEGPFEVQVTIDGYPDNHKIARAIRSFTSGIMHGYEIYREEIAAFIPKIDEWMGDNSAGIEAAGSVLRSIRTHIKGI